jgi:hypothetical protein
MHGCSRANAGKTQDQRHLEVARSSLITSAELQVQSLRLVRNAIRAAGLIPPSLPPGLGHLDTDDVGGNP